MENYYTYREIMWVSLTASGGLEDVEFHPAPSMFDITRGGEVDKSKLIKSKQAAFDASKDALIVRFDADTGINLYQLPQKVTNEIKKLMVKVAVKEYV